MSRNRDELKKGLPKLESMLIDFLLDSGIGPKHIKGNIVLQYAPKIQELCDSITKIRQTALKEIDGGSETPEELEEAAEKEAIEYAKREKPKDADGDIWRVGDVMIENRMSFEDGFIAGYKYHADHTPLPEDTVLFQKGVEEGKRLMMEEAVEARVIELGLGDTPHIILGLSDEFKKGDMVRIIIVKEN